MENTAKIHETAARLYLAAEEVFEDDAPAKVARRLNISAQRLQNWEERGISMSGALKAQLVYGCDANWLLGESESQMWRAPSATSQHLRLEPDNLTETARTLRERFGDGSMVCDLIEHQPHLFIEAYELYASRTRDERTPEEDRALAMKIADLTPQGATKDERGTTVPTEGTTERKMGGSRKRKA